MQIENSLCDYDAVESINREMRKQLQALLNLYGTCPFWTENHLCTNKDCGVAVIDERTIPEEWTSAALGAISSPTNGMSFQPYKSCQLKDQDFCQVDDEALSEGVYVDLMENPERFTGYSGPSAAKVWDAIYNENCFNIAQKMQAASDCEQCSLDQAANAGSNHGATFSTTPIPSEALGAFAAGSSQDEEICLEKRVFYRMISGLHASISIHICDEHFNQTSGVWGPNLECFVSRVGAHPDRLENIYFDYAILVRAVTKLSGYLKDYEFCTGHPKEDARVKAMVDRLIATSTKSPAIFDEKAMFVGPGAQALKLEFRDHFRNITKIMDCVGCEKCRLWGKVQTSGLGTALKVLFSYNDEHLNPIKHPNLLQRTEIVALFNTLNRLSESVESITMFREMYMQQFGPRQDIVPTEVVSSEHQQDPSSPETTTTEKDASTEGESDSPGTQPFFASASEGRVESPAVAQHRPISKLQPAARSPYLTELPLANVHTLIKGTQEWIRSKGSSLSNLVLQIYYHPIYLYYGGQGQAGNTPRGGSSKDSE
ncbi:endoplasmic reticulum Oxidoreductin 1-domain-containing protein [Dissophora ornata]|nr:endoplasmic reticulum Oxidoreductin 1-domain-containing protein [Dissophora ornata]